MAYTIIFTDDAERDLLDIYYYVARTDSVKQAERLLDKLEQSCISLSKLPERGHIPPELENIVGKDLLEIHFKPYRIIYQIIDKDVYVHYIIDGRRDMRSLLEQRLLR